jgi:hypothetical protein
MNKVIKFIQVLIFASSVFYALLFLTTKSADADMMVTFFYSNNRSNVHWEVGYNNMGCMSPRSSDPKYLPCSGVWISTVTHRVLANLACPGGTIGNRCAGVTGNNLETRTSPTYGIRWSTACKDPRDPVDIRIGSLNLNFIDITCRPSDPLCVWTDLSRDLFENQGGGILRFLGWGNTSNCPRYECRPGATTATSCGTGANRCKDVWRECNSNGQWVTRVSSNVNTDCRGVDGCCLQDGNCSGGTPYCGNGTDACSRYEPFCNSNRVCAVRTLSTDSSYCANNTYWACLDDSECGARFCKIQGANTCGICTDYDQIAGRVFVDFDRNNEYDSGIDTPLSGATVERSRTGDNNWSSTSTNSNGYYIFDQLRNPSNQDVRILREEFGLYDDNHCTYVGDEIRSRYQGVVQLTPGHRRNNIDPTPNLSGVLFMLRYKRYNIEGTVYRDGGDGDFSADDVRVNNTNIKIRSNESVTGDFHGNDNIDSNGDYSIPQHINGKSYDIALVQSSLPSTWSILRSKTSIGSNRINGVTINCARSLGNDFLVTDLRSAPLVPDLTIDSFYIPDAQAGTSTTASLVIANYGTEGTGNSFTVTVNNGAGTTRSSVQSALGANATRPVEIIIPVTTDGTYTATARVDTPLPNGVIAESDEDNNETTTDYVVTDTVITPGVDLVVDDLTVLDADIGTTTTGSVIIANRGGASTDSSFSILLSNGDGYTRTEGHPALGAGETGSPISFDLNVPATEGPYAAQATVNPSRTITETNYGNNTREFEYRANFVPPTYSIQGGVFEDEDGDGIKNGNDAYRSGTVSISGVSSFESSAPSGFTATGILEGSYTLTFDAQNDLPMGWQALSTGGIPLTIPPNPSYTAQPGIFCGTTHEHAECLIDGNIINFNFPVRKIPAEPWFYGFGGDMRSDQALENRIPEEAGVFFSERITNKSAGVIFGSNLTVNPFTSLTAKYSNPRNWLVRNRFAASSVRTSYENMEAVLRKNGVWDSASSITGTNILSSISSGVFRVSGNASIPTGDFSVPAGVQAVYMITGNLNINASEITIPLGSSVMFIVRGNIEVSPETSEIHGIYSANQSIIVRGIEDGVTPDGDLIIQGSIIANAGRATSDPFDRRRNLYEGNQQLPIVIIDYRPDFVLNAPPYIKFSNYSIKELAPGAE